MILSGFRMLFVLTYQLSKYLTYASCMTKQKIVDGIARMVHKKKL